MQLSLVGSYLFIRDSYGANPGFLRNRVGWKLKRPGLIKDKMGENKQRLND
jgi:hypothetical protein